MIVPEQIHPGDCIGIFSPAGPVRDPGKVEAGVRLLQDLGYRVKGNTVAGTGNAFLSADDSSRADEFHAMLRDNEVHAMIALRGGYGCFRIAEMLDYNLIARSRKYIIGFSDISILLNIISSRTPLVTIHGPVLTSLASTDQDSLDSLQSILKEGIPESIRSPETTILRSGKCKGFLRGGNLATLVHLIGTPWEVPWEGTILLLEDTAEPLYKLDRMLTQLYYSGRLGKLAGIILGGFDACGGETDEYLEEKIGQRVVELTENYSYPIWANFPVGHREQNRALPLGLQMHMESSTKCLTLLK